MPFPRALSLSHRAELSAAPLLPVRSCSRHRASPQLLCSGLSKPRDHNCSSYTCPSRPIPIFTAILWKLSNIFMSFMSSAGGEAAQHRAQQDSPFPLPAGSVGLMHHLWVLLALGAVMAEWCLIFLPSARTPRSLSVGQLSCLLSPSLCIHPGLPTVGQISALALVQLHALGDCPAITYVKIALQSLSARKGVNSFSNLVMSSDLAYTQVLQTYTISRPSLSFTYEALAPVERSVI